MSLTRHRRYPGLNYFTEDQKDQFFGRDEEIEELLGLVLSEKIVVLFGKSGYGKSSLLRAGILPRLDAAITPVLVQLGAYQAGQSPTPVATTLARLNLALPEDASESGFLEKISDPDTLWHRVKRKQNAARQRFLMIFDQFEEFDSYPAEQKTAFKQQLAELLFTRIPQAVRDRSDALSDEQQSLLAKAPEVKVVFAIREDRLSVLDGLADKLPAILHKRFRLEGLRDEQAREAVVRPAALPQVNAYADGKSRKALPPVNPSPDPSPGGEGSLLIIGHAPLPPWGGAGGGVDQGGSRAFTSPPFTYSAAALSALLRGLKKDAGDARVESFLLQICCEHIEQTIIERTQQQPSGDIVIEPADLPAFNRLFEEYYRGKIAALPDETARMAARRMIEDELVKADPATGIAYRINVDGRQLSKLPGVTEQLLKRLTDDFLLRSEPNTTDGFSYEVSHDRLVEGILNAKMEHEAEQVQLAAERAAREEAERLRREAEAREQQLAAAQVEATKEKRRRQRISLLATVAGIGFFFAGLMGVWALDKKAEAESARAVAIREVAAAIRSNQLERIAKNEALAQTTIALRNDSLAQSEKRRAEDATQTALAQKAQAERNLLERQKADRARELAEGKQRALEIAQMLQQVEVFIRANEVLQALDKVEAILLLDPQNAEARQKKAALLQRLKNN